jgi:hypothetical protein
MVAKSKGKKTAKKSRVKTINLKRDTVKNLSRREQKKVKGGGGMLSGVVMSYER